MVDDREDDVLQLGIKLHEIVERITAYEIRGYEIDLLEDVILEYLDNRKPIFQEYPNLMGRSKPKHHYMTHYGEAIRKFGPPMSYWTGRFESKHRVAKGTAESAKNFKNISRTVSIRQQMRMASTYYNGMFEAAEFSVPEKVTYKRDIPDDTEFHSSLREFMSEKDFTSCEIIVNSQVYRNGDIIVIEAIDRNNLKIGLIESILVKSDTVWFVSKRYLARRCNLGYFISQNQEDKSAFIKSSRLGDFKPLVKHGTSVKFKFSLHHHISVNYS